MNDNFYNWTYWYIIAVMACTNTKLINKKPEDLLIAYQQLIDKAVELNPNYLKDIEKQIKESMN